MERLDERVPDFRKQQMILKPKPRLPYIDIDCTLFDRRHSLHFSHHPILLDTSRRRFVNKTPSTCNVNAACCVILLPGADD